MKTPNNHNPPRPNLSIRYDNGRHHRAKIGFVLLATEQTIEDDVFKLCPAGVGMHFTRAHIPDSITRESLLSQAELLADAAANILPDGSLDVICYACTSGSLVIGEERVFTELQKGAPYAQPTSLITGVINALNVLGSKKIAVATPYLDEINQMEAEYLEQAGFDVTNIQGMNLEHDSDMVRVSPDYLIDFALEVDDKEADTLFISCGALRTLDVIDKIEQTAGKPVICSNQAMIWDTLRRAGIHDSITGYGQLLKDF